MIEGWNVITTRKMFLMDSFIGKIWFMFQTCLHEKQKETMKTSLYTMLSNSLYNIVSEWKLILPTLKKMNLSNY